MRPTWVVCIKQVPREPVFKRTGDALQIDRDRTEGILNPYDRRAVELAVDLKEKQGGEIVVVSMGPPQAEEALREALAFGVDRAVLLSDPAFAGPPWARTACSIWEAVPAASGPSAITWASQFKAGGKISASLNSPRTSSTPWKKESMTWCKTPLFRISRPDGTG